MKAIFCGTPEIAVKALDALTEVARVVGVVCQPDRPSGRGLKLQAPAVKLRALELGLEVIQPLKVRDGTLAKWMRDKNADVALVIAYGRILDQEVLTAPRLGCVNLHASLLPLYRGAAPIQRVIMDGQKETGVCLMQMDEGMDTGDILACHRITLDARETTGTLAPKIAQLAAEVTRLELPRLFRGELTRTEQPHALATYAPPITREDGKLDFSLSADALDSLVRGLSPRPGAVALVRRAGAATRRLKILEVTPARTRPALPPGEILATEGRILIGTGTCPLQLVLAQADGKKPQSGVDLQNGRVLVSGDVLFGEEEKGGENRE